MSPRSSGQQLNFVAEGLQLPDSQKSCCWYSHCVFLPQLPSLSFFPLPSTHEPTFHLSSACQYFFLSVSLHLVSQNSSWRAFSFLTSFFERELERPVRFSGNYVFAKDKITVGEKCASGVIDLIESRLDFFRSVSSYGKPKSFLVFLLSFLTNWLKREDQRLEKGTNAQFPLWGTMGWKERFFHAHIDFVWFIPESQCTVPSELN